MRKGLKFLLHMDAWATLAMGMLGPIYAIFVEEIGGDILDASWAYFAFMLTTGVVMFFVGRWEDKVKHKEKLITLGYALSALGALAYFFVNSQFDLVITQIIVGLSEAVLIPAYGAMYTEFIDRNKVASEWADWDAMRYSITAFAALLGGYIANNFGFRTLFLFMFIASIISVVSSRTLYVKKKDLRSFT